MSADGLGLQNEQRCLHRAQGGGKRYGGAERIVNHHGHLVLVGNFAMASTLGMSEFGLPRVSKNTSLVFSLIAPSTSSRL